MKYQWHFFFSVGFLNHWNDEVARPGRPRPCPVMPTSDFGGPMISVVQVETSKPQLNLWMRMRTLLVGMKKTSPLRSMPMRRPFLLHRVKWLGWTM